MFPRWILRAPAGRVFSSRWPPKISAGCEDRYSQYYLTASVGLLLSHQLFFHFVLVKRVEWAAKNKNLTLAVAVNNPIEPLEVIYDRSRLPSVIIFSAKGRTAFAFAKVVLIRFYSMRPANLVCQQQISMLGFRPNLIVFFA